MEQIILQPNNLFSIYSLEKQVVELSNANEDQVVTYFVDKYLKNVELIQQRTHELITAIRHSPKPYLQFTVTYEEMLTQLEQNYGIDYVKALNLPKVPQKCT